MQPNNNNNIKKKLIYAAIALLTVIIMAVGTVLILKSLKVNNSNNSNSQNTNTVPKDTTGDTMTQAIQLIHSDPTKAKALLEQARKDYQAAGDTNGVVNVDAQLYLLAHPKKK